MSAQVNFTEAGEETQGAALPWVSVSKAIRDEPGRLCLRISAAAFESSLSKADALNAKTLHKSAASELLCIARKDRDSNPGTALDGHTLSRRASSATRASFQMECKYKNYFINTKEFSRRNKVKK